MVHVRTYPDEPERIAQTGDAVRNYFGMRTDAASREFRQLLRYGRLTLLIGLSFLAVCLPTVR